jgi:hypothetical protein
MIDENYAYHCNQKSDINEHLPTLYKYSLECDHITEMGVRDVVSTWAFLKGRPKKFICYDINKVSNIDIAAKYAKDSDIEFEFQCKDVLSVSIEPTDLLFIDTLHQYNQLKKELELHASKVKKYLIFHDTTTFEYVDERSDSVGGLWPAIEEFLISNSEWVIDFKYTNNNGLTILKRIH